MVTNSAACGQPFIFLEGRSPGIPCTCAAGSLAPGGQGRDFGDGQGAGGAALRLPQAPFVPPTATCQAQPRADRENTCVPSVCYAPQTVC